MVGMSDIDTGKLVEQVVRFNVKDPVTCDTWPVALDVAEFWRFYQLIKSEGIEQARSLVLSGLQFARHEVTEEDTRRISAALWEVQHYPVFSPEEIQLWRSYWELQRKETTRDEAAQRASAFLETPISTDAWRKRVDRWAEDQGLPALGQTKRRPRSKLSGH